MKRTLESRIFEAVRASSNANREAMGDIAEVLVSVPFSLLDVAHTLDQLDDDRSLEAANLLRAEAKVLLNLYQAVFESPNQRTIRQQVRKRMDEARKAAKSVAA